MNRGWKQRATLTTIAIAMLTILLTAGCPSAQQATYTVTYDANGATSGSVPTDDMLYAEGDTVAVEGNTGALVKTGFTFSGWNTASDGSGTSHSGGESFVLGASDVILYAKWIAIIPATGVTLNRSSTIIAADSTEQLTATVAPANATDMSVIWTSDDESIATVNTSGLVSAVSAGTTTVTVTTRDGGHTDTCTVTGYYPPGYSQTHNAGSFSFDMHYVPGKTFPTGAIDSGTATAGPFWIGETEVTYEVWYAVRNWAENTASPSYVFANDGREGHDGTDGALPTGANQEPVTWINWRDAMIWSNALTEYYNDQNGTGLSCVYYSDDDYQTPIRTATNDPVDDPLVSGQEDQPYIKAATNGNTDMANCTADGFRMMTSDEWELAARYLADANEDDDITDSGEYYPGSFLSGADRDYTGAGSGDIDGDGDEDTNDEVAVFNDGVVNSTAAVQSKDDNKLGLYDMSGNVYEWCFSWNTVGSSRMMRGGSWDFGASFGRVGVTNGNSPAYEYESIGFRLSRTP